MESDSGSILFYATWPFYNHRLVWPQAALQTSLWHSWNEDRAGEMVQKVKWLPHKCKNLNPNPQNSCKTGIVDHACNSIAFAARWEWRTKESLEMHRLVILVYAMQWQTRRPCNKWGEGRVHSSRLSLNSIHLLGNHGNELHLTLIQVSYTYYIHVHISKGRIAVSKKDHPSSLVGN